MNPTARWAPHKLAADFVAAPSAPPDAHADRVVYGLMQPVLGARMLFADRDLLRAAMVPAGLLALFCAGVAVLDADWTLHDLARSFYRTFALLAPLPSVLLARHYARLASLARNKLGFGPVDACIEPFKRSVGRMIKQAILVAIGLVPVTFALDLVPLVGRPLIHVVVAVWALHWIVVDAFDSARVLQPGQTLADLEVLADAAPRPWFVRWLHLGASRLPVLGAPLHRFANWCDRLSKPWREEVALVETHPSLMIGFALATAALVATPVLNLLFRPIVLIGAAHVLGRVEHVAPAPALAGATTPPSGATPPPVPPT